MSRIETLKSQFPQLDISLLDILSDLDNTKSHKYLQMLCKIFSKSYTFDEKYINDYESYKYEVQNSLSKYGYNIVEKDAAEKWLTRSHIRTATPEEVAREFGK
jgi:uncharacterized protein (UPF0332 family)